MARKNRGGGGQDSGTWMNTYSDLVTLLLTFFAVLLSMSSVDQQKFQAFIASFQAQMADSNVSSIYAHLGDNDFGDTIDGEEVNDETAMNHLYQMLSDYVNQTDQGDSIEVYGGDNVVYIRFNSAAFFEPDKYTLRPGGREMLSYVGDALKYYEASISHINICGHTANPASATAMGTWILSGERAAVVAAYFEDEKALQSDKMIIMGYGKNYPIGDNATTQGMEKNRRVELVVIGNENTDLNTDIYSQYDLLYDDSKYPANGTANDLLVPPTEDSPIQNSASNPMEEVLVGEQAQDQADADLPASQAAQPPASVAAEDAASAG